MSWIALADQNIFLVTNEIFKKYLSRWFSDISIVRNFNAKFFFFSTSSSVFETAFLKTSFFNSMFNICL